MSRLTMQEVIEHCERNVKIFEDNVSFSREWLGMESMPILSKQYLEHKQTAEWLKELQRYKDLEEAGRLIELPCKVGDTVYCFGTFRDGIEECRIHEIDIEEDCVELMEDPWHGVICEAHQLGKVVKSDYEVNGYFLTKAEAEAKLAELKGEQENV